MAPIILNFQKCLEYIKLLCNCLELLTKYFFSPIYSIHLHSLAVFDVRSDPIFIIPSKSETILEGKHKKIGIFDVRRFLVYSPDICLDSLLNITVHFYNQFLNSLQCT